MKTPPHSSAFQTNLNFKTALFLKKYTMFLMAAKKVIYYTIYVGSKRLKKQTEGLFYINVT